MQNVLVIGGSRFIGPYIVDLFLERGYHVTVFNRGHKNTIYTATVKVVLGDRNLGFPSLGHFDTVVDMCAYTGNQTKKAIEELAFDFFIHMGTAAAYKKSEVFPLTEDSPLGEWSMWGDYNRGKVECEEVLEKSGVRHASIRPVYVLGPKNSDARESFIYSRLQKKMPIVLPGNGQALAQFVSVRDVARVVIALAEKQEVGAFNCAGNEIITLRGLVETMANIVSSTATIGYNPVADGANFNILEFPFANENFLCSNEKLKQAGIVFTPLKKFLWEDYKNFYETPY